MSPDDVIYRISIHISVSRSKKYHIKLPLTHCFPILCSTPSLLLLVYYLLYHSVHFSVSRTLLPRVRMRSCSLVTSPEMIRPRAAGGTVILAFALALNVLTKPSVSDDREPAAKRHLDLVQTGSLGRRPTDQLAAWTSESVVTKSTTVESQRTSVVR